MLYCSNCGSSNLWFFKHSDCRILWNPTKKVPMEIMAWDCYDCGYMGGSPDELLRYNPKGQTTLI